MSNNKFMRHPEVGKSEKEKTVVQVLAQSYMENITDTKTVILKIPNQIYLLLRVRYRP